MTPGYPVKDCRVMDKLFVNVRVRICKDEVMLIRRTLPSATGKVNVKVGDEVTPHHILAEGQKSAGFRTVNLADEIGVSPREALKFIRRGMGNNIFKDELLASKEGIFGLGSKILLSPADGILDYYDEQTGRLRIKLFPKTVKLACGVWGIIEGIDESKGVIIIKTMASTVYGVAGSGKEREGTLNVIGSKEVLVGSRQLEETMRGQIIVGGEIVFADGLEKAVELGIAGIVSGGIDAKEYKAVAEGWNIYNKQWSDIGLSLLITEGFGSIHMGDDIFPILQQSHGKFAIIDGNKNMLILPSDNDSCMIDIQKTKLQSGSFAEVQPELSAVELYVGQRVRIVSQEDLGSQGIVEAIDSSISKLPSGLCTTLVTVGTKSRKIRVAYQNLEIL